MKNLCFKLRSVNTHDVAYLGIHVETLRAPLDYSAEVDHPADPLVQVVHELAYSAIRVGRRNKTRLRIKSEIAKRVSIMGISGIPAN